jgi:transcriptional regulator with XRE-family HTH domain
MCTKGGRAMSTGMKLRALRGDKSMQTVADEVGITKSALAMYERDERTPRDEVKVKLANYYGQTVQSLFFSS